MLALLPVAPAAAQTMRERIVAAEDARVATDAAIAPIVEALRSSDPSLVALAARALGRFERPAFAQHLLPLLTHPRTEVRREAANALGQSVAAVPRTGDVPPPPELALVTSALLDRLAVEEDPSARGAIAETLGRLPQRNEQTTRQIESALRDRLATLHPDSLTGVIKGLEAWLRNNQARYAAAPPTIERLRAMATLELHRLEPSFAYIRRVAWFAANGARAADLPLVEHGLTDPDAQIRRLAVLALPDVTATDAQRRTVLTAALADRSFHVRYDAVRAYSRLLQASDCAPVLAALDDVHPYVRLAAIDALATPCPAGADAVARLTALADAIPNDEGGEGVLWHEPAHAIVALATVAPANAASRLPRFVQHPSWHVRAYAARAAAVVRDAAVLELLARDEDDNVRYEAVVGLRQMAGHAADPIFVEALARPDYQLVLTAAQALEGSPNRETAVAALLRTFARLTLERRETSRDPRMAILARLRELGSPASASGLNACLTDFDPVVAAECATILQAWTGVPQTPRPRPLRPQPVDDRLPTRARFVMRGDRTFDVMFFTDDTPATVSRVAQLTRRGYYNGLAFHRVVPNFVLQGGSPGANEYAGDGPFMRDELGLRANMRGTLGISTRGRDTGDAQFFINLVDNPRLDHEYTVFGEVTSGMDVVDAILEGDVIERIELR